MNYLCRFKCDKEIGEIKFENSGLKGVDKKSLIYLPHVERITFEGNYITELVTGRKWE